MASEREIAWMNKTMEMIRPEFKEVTKKVMEAYPGKTVTLCTSVYNGFDCIHGDTEFEIAYGLHCYAGHSVTGIVSLVIDGEVVEEVKVSEPRTEVAREWDMGLSEVDDETGEEF